MQIIIWCPIVVTAHALYRAPSPLSPCIAFFDLQGCRLLCSAIAFHFAAANYPIAPSHFTLSRISYEGLLFFYMPNLSISTTQALLGDFRGTFSNCGLREEKPSRDIKLHAGKLYIYKPGACVQAAISKNT